MSFRRHVPARNKHNHLLVKYHFPGSAFILPKAAQENSVQIFSENLGSISVTE